MILLLGQLGLDLQESALEMDGLILLIKLITTILICGQLELLRESSEMCALGSKQTLSLISMMDNIKKLQISSIS